jgi:hypothetical protein
MGCAAYAKRAGPCAPFKPPNNAVVRVVKLPSAFQQAAAKCDPSPHQTRGIVWLCICLVYLKGNLRAERFPFRAKDNAKCRRKGIFCRSK